MHVDIAVRVCPKVRFGIRVLCVSSISSYPVKYDLKNMSIIRWARRSDNLFVDYKASVKEGA